MKVCAPAFVAALALLASPLRAAETAGATLPEHHAADASAAVVTAETLLANDRFWPYQVALTWALPEGGGMPALGPGELGVLIRVEPGGVARIDFGRDGLRVLPVAKTDLVERANRVRTGALEKTAPNFVLAIGPRLVDSAGDALRAMPYEKAAEHGGFLCVFANPDDAGFPALAAALAPLQDRHGVWTLFFPQGEIPDAKLRERLRALEWPVPFVYDHLAEAYTSSLLATGDALPFVMLQTREGRVLYEGPWKPDVAPQLQAELDEAFGAATATTATALKVDPP